MTFDQWWESTGAAMFEKNMGYTTAKAAWEASRGDVSRDSVLEEAAELASYRWPSSEGLQTDFQKGYDRGRNEAAILIRALKRQSNSPRSDK